MSLGITPARAGKTDEIEIRQAAEKDHPRSCGKDSTLHAVLQPSLGSPPLVRERLHAPMYAYHSARITPARAGKTRHPLFFRGTP